MAETLIYEVRDHVALVTLNRPEAMNTLSAELLGGLGDALQRADTDDDVRVVVLTGSGRAFCAGADLSDGAATFDAQSVGQDVPSCPLSIQPWQVRKPVIAACNGHAIGVGMSLTLQCDLRVYAEEGKYGLLQNRLGVVSDNAVAWVLTRLLGIEKAFDLLVRAPRLTGVEAGEMGLAGRVVPAEAVLDTAMELAREIATRCSPLVAAMHKQLLWQSMDLSLSDYAALETRAMNFSMAKPDAVEGGSAYFEKREPRWQSALSRDWPEFL